MPNFSIQGWSTEIDEITRRFKSHFENLSDEELNWKPRPESWSIAQNIEHLIIINESYFPIFNKIASGEHRRPLLGKLNFYVRFCGKMILNSVQPDRRRKTKTFPIWQPSQDDIPANILKRFENHQTELKFRISNLKNKMNQGIIIPSPANKYIIYKLETALNIIIAHEKRHLEQAKELLSMKSAITNE